MLRPDVVLHGIAPRSLDRCALIRDWLADLGVDRVTLLVGRADGGGSGPSGDPRLATWLVERCAAGDELALAPAPHEMRRIDVHPDISRRRVRAVERLLARVG